MFYHSEDFSVSRLEALLQILHVVGVPFPLPSREKFQSGGRFFHPNEILVVCVAIVTRNTTLYAQC